MWSQAPSFFAQSLCLHDERSFWTKVRTQVLESSNLHIYLFIWHTHKQVDVTASKQEESSQPYLPILTTPSITHIPYPTTVPYLQHTCYTRKVGPLVFCLLPHPWWCWLSAPLFLQEGSLSSVVIPEPGPCPSNVGFF